MTISTHLDITKRLCDHNHDTYLVGGGIRDMLSGNEPKDFDVVTAATPKAIMELFADCAVKTIGKSFGVVLVNGFEIATFRHDRQHGIGDKNHTVYFARSIQEDLNRIIRACRFPAKLEGQFDLPTRISPFPKAI